MLEADLNDQIVVIAFGCDVGRVSPRSSLFLYNLFSKSKERGSFRRMKKVSFAR
jgi:hypothetical protein